MGEYLGKYKVGTVEHCMYFTREEIKFYSPRFYPEVERFLDLKHRWIFRLDFEGRIRTLKEIEQYNYKDYEFECSYNDFEHKQFCQVNCSGTTYNFPFCLQSKNWKDVFKESFKSVSIGPVNSFNKIKLQILGNRYTPENPEGYTVFQCAVCGSAFALSEKELSELIPTLYNVSDLIKKQLKPKREELNK